MVATVTGEQDQVNKVAGNVSPTGDKDAQLLTCNAKETMRQADDEESDSDYVPRPDDGRDSDSSSDEDNKGNKQVRLAEDKLESGEQDEDPEARKARLQRQADANNLHSTYIFTVH